MAFLLLHNYTDFILFSLQAQTAKPAVKRALPWKRPKTAMSPTYAHFRQASLRLLRASS